MPVIAELITQPSEQDLTDLNKTYEGNIEWLQAVLEGPDLMVGGRFNDRLVAAFVLRDEESCWRLEKLQVREITRRRGVARQTLHSAQKTLKLERPILVDLSAHLELLKLFESQGFVATDSKAVLQWQG